MRRGSCERVDRIARGVDDAIHGSGDLVSRMPGKILRKGVTKELAAGPFGAARKQFGLFKDGVRYGYSRFHTISITKLLVRDFGSVVG